MTSVHDLRILFNLDFQALTTDEMHAFITAAFNQATTEKLVYDDHTAVFFKMGLRECKRQQFISQAEREIWDLQATKVTVENSDWVRQIKQSLQQLDYRLTTTEGNVVLLHKQFDALRNALLQRERSLIEQRKRHRYVSLLSSALILRGGGAIKEMFKDAFTCWDPKQLLSILSADHMAGYLADQTNTLVFKGCVNAVLADAKIDAEEFAGMLRDAVALEHSEVVPVENRALPASDSALDMFPPKKGSTFRAAVHAGIRRAKAKTDDGKLAAIGSDNTSVTPSSISPAPLACDSQMTDSHLEAYPYHCAVQFTERDLEQFVTFAKYIEQEGGDINEKLPMYVRPAGTDGTSGNGETVEASALMYASYLGHVEIVKWFLDRADVVKNEKSYLTIKRSLFATQKEQQ